jgi:hypothetical protein
MSTGKHPMATPRPLTEIEGDYRESDRKCNAYKT